jgi:hypothetical protein
MSQVGSVEVALKVLQGLNKSCIANWIGLSYSCLVKKSSELARAVLACQVNIFEDTH